MCLKTFLTTTLLLSLLTPIDLVLAQNFANESHNTFQESLLEAETIDESNQEFEDDLISVNFQNIDINQIIKVLGDITEKIIIPHDGLSGEITINSLERVEPNIVINVLESALMVKGYTLVETKSSLRIVPLPEIKQTNVTVGIGASPDSIEDNDIVITQVMPLQYSSAIKLKTTLQPLVGKHGNILANERTNTLIITDLSSNIKRLAIIIKQMERPLPSEIEVKTFVLNYGDSETIAKILDSLSQDNKNIPYHLSQVITEKTSLDIYGEIQAFAEKETNSVIVATAPVNLPSIAKLIEKLDMFPPQAMIEVILMDVTLDDDFTLGVEFSDQTTPSLTTQGYISDLTGNGTKESIFHSLLGLTTDAATEGFTYRVLNAKQTFQALTFVLKSQENTKVLSTPKILASNNQESSITVGQEVPIIDSSTTDLVNNITTTDFHYEDIGIILNVTPRISQDDYVNLKIHVELKDLSAQTLLNASIINKREADATVMIPDNHTVVLGGLMRDNNSIIEKKIPYLGDVPVLGNLFKKTSTSLLKTELLIFITPHIIKNISDIKILTEKPQEHLKNIQDAQTTKYLRSAVETTVGYKNPKKKKNRKN